MRSQGRLPFEKCGVDGLWELIPREVRCTAEQLLGALIARAARELAREGAELEKEELHAERIDRWDR